MELLLCTDDLEQLVILHLKLSQKKFKPSFSASSKRVSKFPNLSITIQIQDLILISF